MTLREAKIALAAGEIACTVVSFGAVRAAGQAMQKTGIGDLERFAFWNSIVALSFMLFFLLWVAAVLLAVFTRQRERSRSAREFWMSLVPDVLLPPALMAAAWGIYMFLW